MDVLDFSDRAGDGKLPILGLSVRKLAQVTNNAFSFGYGVFCMIMLGTQAWWEGTVRRPVSKAFWSKVDTERRRLWSLSEYSSDFRHKFFVHRNGHSTHYLELGPSTPPIAKTKTLVIFIHGWPDAGHLWQSVCDELLQTRTFDSLDTTALLAPDMPGYGGSGSTQRFGTSEVLGSLVQFVAAMRVRHLPEGKGKVVVVSHDWGAVVSWRLAAEAPEIADSFIIANGPPTFLAKQNSGDRLALYQAHMGEFLRNPFRTSSAYAAMEAIGPCLKQLSCSHYIFIFALPKLLSSFAFGIGNHYFSYYVALLGVAGEDSLYKEAEPKQLGPSGTSRFEDAIATQLATALGPNDSALRSFLPGKEVESGAATYDKSVWSRVLGHGGRGNVSSDSIRYYQEGLAMSRWTFDTYTDEAIVQLRKQRGITAQPNAFAEQEKRGLRHRHMPKAPVRLVWGEKDPALDKRIMLSGIEDWIGGWENMVMVKTSGHWVPTERGPAGIVGEGTRIIAKCLADSIEGRFP